MSLDANAEPAPQSFRTAATKSSFYLAMRVMEPHRREAMFAIYAFCRAVDDIADGDGDRDARLAQLDDWRRDLDDLYAGRIRARCAFLKEPVRRFGLDRADFEAVIDGMAMDVVEDIRAPDWATLDRYCDHVASAVGRLCVRVFGLGDENEAAWPALGELPTQARMLAHYLGRALQLTNILRDLDEDAARGRLYLPREALLEAGITEVAPQSALAHPALGEACAAVAAKAREHYARAAAVMAACSKRAVRAPGLMAAAYGSILDRLVARGFAPPRAPVHASRLKIVLALLRSALP
jgi:phytoene synthase